MDWTPPGTQLCISMATIPLSVYMKRLTLDDRVISPHYILVTIDYRNARMLL